MTFSPNFKDADCVQFSETCVKFWKNQYRGMDCLMTLIRSIGWIASASNRAVVYEIQYFRTIQDYHKSKRIEIRVYDRHNKKDKKVSFRVPIDQRDHRKTETATFANFVHHADSCIATSVVELLKLIGAPLYTVHDNFITTPHY